MIKGICLPYNYILDKRVEDSIRKFNGILLRNTADYIFYKSNRGAFPNSMTENMVYKQSFLELIHYIDEPISTPAEHKEIWKVFPDSIVGELTDRAFNQMSNPITYTAYTKLIDVFGWFRIPIPFTNQLSTWEKMRKTYLNKFPFVWIHLVKNGKDFTELKMWAMKYNKGIWIYCPDKINKEELIERINNLNL